MNVSGLSPHCMSSEQGPGKFCSNSDLQKRPVNTLTAFYVKSHLGSAALLLMLGGRDETGSVNRLYAMDKLSPWHERMCQTLGWKPGNSLSRGRGCRHTAQIIYSKKQTWYFESDCTN